MNASLGWTIYEAEHESPQESADRFERMIVQGYPAEDFAMLMSVSEALTKCVEVALVDKHPWFQEMMNPKYIKNWGLTRATYLQRYIDNNKTPKERSTP